MWRRKYTSPFSPSSSLDPLDKQIDLPSRNIPFSLLIFMLSASTHTWRYVNQSFMPLSSPVLENQCFNCPSNSVSHWGRYLSSHCWTSWTAECVPWSEEIMLSHSKLYIIYLLFQFLYSTKYLHLLLGKKKVHPESGSIPVKTNLYLLLPTIQGHQHQ